jgi:hypothetical protein
MKTVVIVMLLLAALTMCANAEENAGRYKFYTIKSGNNEIAILLDSFTGKNWQVFVDSLGKVTKIAANTVEGVVYAPKDSEQLYTKVQSAGIDGLSVSDNATRVELDKSYGYGLDPNELVLIREKIKSSTIIRK